MGRIARQMMQQLGREQAKRHEADPGRSQQT
jgi:hypothetical protein